MGKMNKYLKIILSISIALFLCSCVMKNGKVQKISFNNSSSIKNMNDVEKERDNLVANKKKAQAVQLLIEAYNRSDLSYDVRMASLEALAESKDKLVLEAIQKSVRNVELLDFDMMIKSIQLLTRYDEVESVNSLIAGLKKSEMKIMQLREVIINAIGENGSDNQIITLLDLYEISRANHQKNSELLALTLGKMGDDRAVPILMSIAKNKENNLRTRKLAVDMLAKKDATELVDYFIDLLGDPDSREGMNEFAMEVMGDLDNKRMTLALLESYQIGKQQYYSMLIKLMDVMSDSNNLYLKPIIVEIALTEHLPYHLRIKALKTLPNFGDPSIIDNIIILLEKAENYIFYEHIVEMILALDSMPEYESKLRATSYQAMINEREKK